MKTSQGKNNIQQTTYCVFGECTQKQLYASNYSMVRKTTNFLASSNASMLLACMRTESPVVKYLEGEVLAMLWWYQLSNFRCSTQKSLVTCI